MRHSGIIASDFRANLLEAYMLEAVVNKYAHRWHDSMILMRDIEIVSRIYAGEFRTVGTICTDTLVESLDSEISGPVNMSKNYYKGIFVTAARYGDDVSFDELPRVFCERWGIK